MDERGCHPLGFGFRFADDGADGQFRSKSTEQ
jgi:hypothetical protein